MADRTVRETAQDVPELPELLVQILNYVIEEGKARLDADDAMNPFTAVVVKDNVFLEDALSANPEIQDTVESVYAIAQHTVQGVRGADVYGFCYDGYIETDAGTQDAIIAEGGLPGALEGHAVGLIYEVDAEGNRTYSDEVAYIGIAPNFMISLTDIVEEPEAEEAAEGAKEGDAE